MPNLIFYCLDCRVLTIQRSHSKAHCLLHILWLETWIWQRDSKFSVTCKLLMHLRTLTHGQLPRPTALKFISRNSFASRTLLASMMLPDFIRLRKSCGLILIHIPIRQDYATVRTLKAFYSGHRV